jgi:hypothetical protein
VWIFFIKQIDAMFIVDDDDWSLPNERLDVFNYCENFYNLSFSNASGEN